MKTEMARVFIDIPNIKFQEHPRSRSQIVKDTVTSIGTQSQKRKYPTWNGNTATLEIITTVYLHMHSCMNTLCGILNSFEQNITYTICGSVTHKMPNVICSYAAPIKFQASALISGIKGLNNKKKLCTKHDTLHLLFTSWITTHWRAKLK